MGFYGIICLKKDKYRNSKNGLRMSLSQLHSVLWRFSRFHKIHFCVCVSFSQIFEGKFELWREAWGDWGYWRNGGIRVGVDGVENKGLVTGNMEVKHNMSFAYSLCMGDSTGSLGRSYLILRI